MTKPEESISEQLRRTAHNASARANGTAPLDGEILPPLTEDEARQKAYEEAMANSFANRAFAHAHRMGLSLKSVFNPLAQRIAQQWEAAQQTSRTAQTLTYGFNLASLAVTKIAWPMVRPFVRLSKWTHNKIAWVTPPKGRPTFSAKWPFVTREKAPNSRPVFSAKRSFFASVGIAAAAYVAVFDALPILAEISFDAAAINLSSGQETIYVNSTKTIDGNKGIYGIGGCDTYPCSSDDSYSLRIRDSYYLDLMQMVTGKNMGFFPDQVVHVVPAAGGICEIDYWGFRARFIRRNFDWFAYVRKMNCVPATYENANLHLGERPKMPVPQPRAQ